MGSERVTGKVVWEICGHHLTLGRTERSGIDDCVNPSIQHQKANTLGLGATCLSLALSPDRSHLTRSRLFFTFMRMMWK